MVFLTDMFATAPQATSGSTAQKGYVSRVLFPLPHMKTAPKCNYRKWAGLCWIRSSLCIRDSIFVHSSSVDCDKNLMDLNIITIVPIGCCDNIPVQVKNYHNR
jgi:hypothetical protein